MKKLLAFAVTIFSVSTAQAALLGRDINGVAVAGGAPSAVFLYDTVLDITWLRDANSNGQLTWDQANTWAAQLSVGTYADWRLPAIIANADATINYAGGTDQGTNVRTKSGDPMQYQAGQTVYSEMAHLYYSTLGNLAYCTPAGSSATTCGHQNQTGYGLAHTGDFKNLISAYYWTGLEHPPLSVAFGFDNSLGFQDLNEKAARLYALAVRPGDVLTSAVPEPQAWVMTLAGLGLVSGAMRRRKLP